MNIRDNLKNVNQLDTVASFAEHVQEICRAEELFCFDFTIKYKDFDLIQNQNIFSKARAIEEIWGIKKTFNRILNSLLDTNFTRHLERLPRFIGFIDFPQSRRGQKPAPSNYDGNRPHIHGVYLVSQEHFDEFQKLAENNYKDVIEKIREDQKYIVRQEESNLSGTIRQYEKSILIISAYTKQKESIKETYIIDWIKYSGKYLRFAAAKELSRKIDLYNIFPIAKSELQNKKARKQLETTC